MSEQLALFRLERPCSIEGCDRPIGPHGGRGWCPMHYKRWYKFGDPLAAPARPTMAERFWAKVDKNGPVHPRLGTRCWVWAASVDPLGYGQLSADFLTASGRKRAMVGSHRYSFRLATGMFWPWIAHLEVDHRCHNPRCVRPAHLRSATRKQNLENRSGPTRRSKSGVRGVVFDPRYKKPWLARVRHNGKDLRSRYATQAEAEAAAIAKRNELFSHNDADR
jgi:hypothetical protein